MNSFSDEQSDVIRTVYGIPEEVSVTLFSLTNDNAWHDVSIVLIFAMEESDREKWEALKLEATTEKQYIVFHDTAYYLSRTGSIEPYHICREYLPVEGTGAALYSFHKSLSFPAETDLDSMLKEFGEKVDGLPRYEVVI